MVTRYDKLALVHRAGVVLVAVITGLGHGESRPG